MALVTGAAAAAGCNLVFGIDEGVPGGQGGGGGTSTMSTTSTGGSGGTPVCPPDKPSSCEEPYLTDQDNCCAAGRSCLGGECQQGTCLTALHGQTVQKEEAISVVRSGDYLLWSGGYEKTITRTGVDGDGLKTIVSSGQTDFGYVTMLAADPGPGGYVFFTDYGGGRIGRASVETGQTVVLAELPPQLALNAASQYGTILVHGDYVYWAPDGKVTDGQGVPVNRNIWRVPREPDGILPVQVELVVDTTSAYGLAADDNYLYFGDTDLGTVERIDWLDIGDTDAGGDPILAPREVLAQGQSPIGALAVDAQYVYWAFYNEVRYMEKDLPNSTVTILDGIDTYVSGIETDGRDVYITAVGNTGDGTQGAFFRAPVGSRGPVTRLYTAEGDGAVSTREVRSLTQDCDTVYFVLQQGGLIRRLVK